EGLPQALLGSCNDHARRYILRCPLKILQSILPLHLSFGRAFNECQPPDETQRMQLRRELGLAPRQIKFWFQNRRKHKKAQHERADRICCENISIREALKHTPFATPVCSSMAASSLLSLPNFVISDMDKSRMTNNAMDHLDASSRCTNEQGLTQTNEPLWIRTDGCLDILNLKSYESAFPIPKIK
ncbi:unnamed protein product, partial [Brassica rapa subsp. trilocularis]